MVSPLLLLPPLAIYVIYKNNYRGEPVIPALEIVSGKKLMKYFINFPYQHYKGHPVWIPPLRMEQKKLFSPKTNSVLREAHYRFFLLREKEEIIGRIAAWINPIANAHWKEDVGFFGYYECINDEASARLLLSASEQWLKERGMCKMRGQWNFETQDMGLIYEGFDLPPVILSSYNYPYYIEQIEDYGLKKVKDLLVYNADVGAGYRIPQRFIRFTDRIAQRYGVTVRQLDMNKLVDEALLIVRLTNASLRDNWGFYPVDESEAEQLAKDLKTVIHPEGILFAEAEGQAIGYIIALPDVNHLFRGLNGHLLPIGIFRLLNGIKRLNRYRIWALGILDKYQKKGISALLFRALNDSLAQKSPYVEANWVLEGNRLMNNTMKQLGFNLVKRYRIYEKTIE